MLEEYLVDTCYKVTTVRNEYGDYLQTATTALNCRFRYINSIRRGSHEESNDSDAMIWFAPEESIEHGSIILFDSVYYQVERIYKAKRLGEADVQFLKCELKIIDLGIS